MVGGEGAEQREGHEAGARREGRCVRTDGVINESTLTVFLTRFSLAAILVQNGTNGGMTPASSTRISARLKRARNTVHP